MKKYEVRVIISTKPELDDPEGETILKNLVLKKNSTVTKIRISKILSFTILEKNKAAAKLQIQKLCNELRLYNNLVSTITIDVLN
ncbi:MAG: phosphoribosylformylglycinamidine synthase subunit PurS [Thaumarchaeota archaeon]|nr:phosphoribosylformylglycinamidine synthase subunit PurS [Nitrososphaerota archaeon]MCY3975575.1 phosphoribosylformylglycinamidine synthase subunit PurS [Nitrososphaerota archaeon]